MKQTFTTGDVARLVGVAPRTVHGWADRGLLPFFRIPGSKHRRITRRDLEAFLKRHGLPMKLGE